MMNTPTSDLATLDLQIAALFHHDHNGRILGSNEPPPNRPAPRFFFGRTTQGNRWRFRDDLAPKLVDELDALARSEPVATDLRQPIHHLEQMRAALTRHAPISGEYSGPAYRFTDDPGMPPNVVMIDHANLALLERMEPDMPRFERYLDLLLPCAVVVEDGIAVSMCFSARLSAHVAEAGLDTLPQARRRGYGAAVTAAWAHAVYAAGRAPLYSTAWTNVASQGVARRLGLALYAEDHSFA